MILLKRELQEEEKSSLETDTVFSKSLDSNK